MLKKASLNLIGWLKAPESSGIILLLFTRIILVCIGLLVLKTIGKDAIFPSGVFPYTGHLSFDLWGHWDTSWYLKIAHDWYSEAVVPGGQASYAFFPLYPLAIRIVGAFIHSNYLAGLIVSNLCLAAAGIYLYRYISLKSKSDHIASMAVLIMFLYPFSFLYSSVLTESAFLLLAVLTFYLMEKGNFGRAGIAGFLAALTRSVGIFLVIPLAIRLYKTKSLNLINILKIAIIPLGTVVFAVYNYHLTGDFFSFAHIQSAWNKSFGDPVSQILKPLIDPQSIYDSFSALTALVVLILLIIYRKYLSLEEWCYSIILILFPALGGVVSMPRYTLVIFPLFLLFAKLSEKRYARDLLIGLFCFLQAIFFAAWVLGTYLII